MPRTYEPIATTTLGSDTATITFSSIPATYTDLIIMGFMRATAASYNNMNYPRLRFNGDTGSDYSHTALYQENSGGGETVGSVGFSNETSMNTGGIATNSFSSNVFSSYIVNVMNYANTTTNKTVLTRVGVGGGITNMQANATHVGLWRDTSAINEITLTASTGSFVTGTTLTLYGVKSA